MKRFAGFGKRHQPVMDHAPDIAEHDLDAVDKVAQSFDKAE